MFMFYIIGIMKTQNNEKTAIWIRKSRFKLEMNQKQLAEKLEIKPVNISHYEKGRNAVPGKIILKIQEMLNDKAEIDSQSNSNQPS